MSDEYNDSSLILSVGDAHSEACKTRDRDKLRAIADTVIHSDAIRGNADEFHNLAVEYTREWDDYMSGYDIIRKGLSYYPANVDLLADAIYYGSEAGRYDECKEQVERLKKVPLPMWNWRAFTFLIDFYLDELDCVDWWDQEPAKKERLLENNLNQALRFAKLEQKILDGSGDAERGYLAECKVRLTIEKVLRAKAALIEVSDKYNKDDDARVNEILQEAAEEHDRAEKILQEAIDKRTFSALACCLKLADTLFERQEFERTIDICKEALGFGASQPSANVGYLTYLAALSEDSLIHRDRLYTDEKRIRQAYEDFACAYKLNSDSGRRVYLRNIKDRIAILEAQTGIEATQLVTAENDESPDISDIMGLLSNVRSA